MTYHYEIFAVEKLTLSRLTNNGLHGGLSSLDEIFKNEGFRFTVYEDWHSDFVFFNNKKEANKAANFLHYMNDSQYVVLKVCNE